MGFTNYQLLTTNDCFSLRTFNKSGWLCRVSKLPCGKVSKAQNLRHLYIVDLVCRVRSVVVVRVKTGKPPEGRHIFQHKRELIASEKDVQGCFMVKAIIQCKAHNPVLLLNHLLIIRTVHRANKV